MRFYDNRRWLLARLGAVVLAAVLLTSAFTMLMNITMFWTISGRGIQILISGTLFLASGMIIPLPLFPDFVQPIIRVLPFRGVIDLPFRLFTENIPADQVGWILMHQLAWMAGLVALVRWLL